MEDTFHFQSENFLPFKKNFTIVLLLVLLKKTMQFITRLGVEQVSADLAP